MGDSGGPAVGGGQPARQGSSRPSRPYTRGLTQSLAGPGGGGGGGMRAHSFGMMGREDDEEAARHGLSKTDGDGMVAATGAGLTGGSGLAATGPGNGNATAAGGSTRQPFARQSSRRIRWIPTVVEFSNTVANLAHRNDRLRQLPTALSGRGFSRWMRGHHSSSMGGVNAPPNAHSSSNVQHKGSLRFGESGLGTSAFGRRPLHDAWALPLADLKALVKARREDLNVMDNTGSTPLMYFSEMATVDHALLLLDYGADIEIADFNGANALSRAAAANRTDMVLALYEWVERHAAPVDRQLVLWAVNEGETGLLDSLLQEAALDVDWVIEESNRHTALHIATLKGYTDLIEVLLRRHADLTLTDVNANTPLHLALLNRNLEAAKLLIRSGAPLDIPNRSNKVPMDLCAETMTLVEFVSLVQETYDSMVALVVPFILRTSMTEKHALLAQLVAGQVEKYAPDDAALFEEQSSSSSEDEDEEDEDEDLNTPETVVDKHQAGTPSTARVDDPPPSLGEVGKRGAARAIKGVSNTCQVRHDFETDVFAAPVSKIEAWEGLLSEEYGSPAETLFLTLFYTKREGYNLLLTYLRNLDPVGVSFVLASYCVCLSLALLSVLGFACAILLAFGVVLFYVTTAHCLWLLWRYGLSPLYHSCRTTAVWLTSRGEDMGLTSALPSPGSHHLATPSYLHRRGRHTLPRFLSAFYHRYSPSYVTAWIISSFYCQWEVLRSTRHRRTTYVACQRVKIMDVCDADPAGLLSPLIAYNVPSFIYGIDSVQAVIDFKFRTISRAVLRTELSIYCLLLAAFTAYLAHVHDPSSSVYHDTTLDWDHLIDKREHMLAGITLLLLFRIFRLSIMHMFRCLMGWSSQSLLVWGSSIWTWMNVLGFPLFLFCVLAPPKHLISHLMASVAFILWWKSLYFLKGFRATGPLVQTVTKTFAEIRWFLLLLAIIIFGFGSCFYTLFRVDAYEKSRDPHSNYVWSSTAGVFLSLLSILLGNFDPNEFIHSHVSTMAIIFLVAYVVLVVIVMLNLLIAIVSTVYDQLQASHTHEFLRAKAELICEVEQQFFLPRHDQSWFPKKLYFISKIPTSHVHTHRRASPPSHPPNGHDKDHPGHGKTIHHRRNGSKDPTSLERPKSGTGLPQHWFPSPFTRADPPNAMHHFYRPSSGAYASPEHALPWLLRYRGSSHATTPDAHPWAHSPHPPPLLDSLAKEVDRLNTLQQQGGRRQRDMEDKLTQALDILKTLQQQQIQQPQGGPPLQPPPLVPVSVREPMGGGGGGSTFNSTLVRTTLSQTQRRPPPLLSPGAVAVAAPVIGPRLSFDEAMLPASPSPVNNTPRGD